MKDRDMRSSMGNIFRWIAPLEKGFPGLCLFVYREEQRVQEQGVSPPFLFLPL